MKRHTPPSRSTPAARLLLALLAAASGQSLHAASQTWSASPTDANWSTAANWAGGAAPGIVYTSNATNTTDIATFNSAIGGTIGTASNPILIEANRMIGGLTFDTASAGSYFIGATTGSPTLTFGNNLTTQMTASVVNAQTINAAIALHLPSSTNGAYTVKNDSTTSTATFTLAGGIVNSPNSTRGTAWTLSGTNTGDNTVSGVINITNSGGISSTLTKAGTGKWILTNANTIQGGVIVNGGTLVAANAAALGTVNPIVNSGGTLQIANVALNNTSITLNDGGTIQGNGAAESAKIVNVSATATGVTLSTVGAGDVFTVGVAANGFTGGQASTVTTISGPGTVLLGQASNYAGGYSINAGTLQIGNATALGSAPAIAFGASSTGKLFLNGNSVTVKSLASNATVGAPVIENNSSTAATLTIGNTSGSTAYAGVIQDGAAGGALGLVKTGASNQTLTGANTYTGGTTISGGTLTANGSGALGTGSVTVGSGATLAATSLTLSNLALSGTGTLALTDFNSHITSTGTVSISGSGNLLTLGGSTAVSGSTYTLLSAGSLSAAGLSISGTGVSGLTIALGDTGTIGRTNFAFTNTGTALQLAVTGGAFNLTWNGGNANWNATDANWQKNGTGSNIAFFAGDNITIASGDTIAVDAGGITAGTLAVTNASGTATLNGGNLTANSLTKTGAGSLAVNNAFTTVGGINVQAGSVALNAANTISGAITVSGGTLTLGTNNAAGSGASTLTVSGGQFDLGANNQSLANVTLTGGSITGTTGVLSATGNTIDAQSGSVSASLAGSVGLAKTTAGTVILSGDNTYTGVTTIGAGTLQIGNGGTTGSIVGTGGVTNSGTLAYNRSDALTVGYVVSGTGALVKDGSGTLILNNANTYTGATTVNSGTLQIGNGGTAGSIVGTGGVTNNATLAYNRSDAVTVGYVISGTGAVVKDGANTLTLSGANTYSGGTALNSGTLAINNGSALGTGTLTALNGTTVSLVTSSGTGNSIALSGSGASVTLTSNQASSGFGSNFTGTADHTLVISSAGGQAVNVNNTTRQFVNFLGTVNVLTGATLADRSSSTTWVNGGDNTLFNIDGFISSRNGGNWALGGLTGSGTLSMGGSGSNGIGLNYTIGARNDANNTFSGVIQDGDTANGKTVSVTKVGTGTLTLAGSNIYTGTTTISGGTLALGASSGLASTSIVNNAILDVSAVSGFAVNSGQTLSGSGTVNGSVIVNGSLNPGNSPGVLTFNNGLTLAGTANFEINGTTRGTGHDAVNVGGTVTYGGVLNLIFGSSFLTGSENFALFNGLNGTDAPLDAGSFTQIELQGAYTASLTNNSGVWTGTSGGYDFTFTQDTGILSVLAGAAIPEPSTYAMLAGALGLAYAALRRRRAAVAPDQFSLLKLPS